MKRKPIPIIILAILHFLEPLFKVPLYSLLLKVPPKHMLGIMFMNSSTFRLFEFFTFFPIAGFAILMTKSWSYPIFLIIEVWTLASHFVAWKTYPHYFTMPLMLTFDFLNLVVVTYFLIPAVRATYFDKKLRWWESRPRFRIKLNAKIIVDQKPIEVVIHDISQGGVFVETTLPLTNLNEFMLSIAYYGLDITLPAKAIYQRKSNFEGYGVEFIRLNKEAKKKLKRLMEAFDLLEIERTSEPAYFWKDCKDWVIEFFKTGKGLLPELPQKK